MKLQQILCFSMLLATVWTTDVLAVVDPRGNRPVEQGYKTDKCATEKEWPFCTDDDWGPKCPSGCRIQGLLDKTDHDLLTRIDKIRQLLDDNRQKYRSTDQSSKQTYDYLRDRLTTSSGHDNRYMSLAESLRQRIVDMKIKIERQLNILEGIKKLVRNQIIEMQRLEVDIDIKLRACKGSCAEYAEFSVDRESYVAIDKQMDQLESMRVNSVETVGALRVMKSRVIKEVVVPSIYKSGLTAEPQEQKQYFADLSQPKLTLQGEGATADTPATVSKFPGSASVSSSSAESSYRFSLPGSKFTGTASSSSSSSPFSDSSSHLSMPASSSQFPGAASSSSSSSSFSDSSRLSSSTHTMKCTRTVRKVVTHTKDGPVEKQEIVLTGEGCDAMGGGDHSMTSFTQPGGSDFFGGDFFKEFGGIASSSERSAGSTKSMGSSKTMSSTKSLLSSTKSGSAFEAFGRGDVDEDLPDIFARSGKPGTQ